MKLRLIKIRDSLADSFWFIPTLMAWLAGCAALGSTALDHAMGAGWVKNIGWVWSGGPDGARAVLSVVGGSVMTVVSIVFSLTVATLAQTSSHYGPRVLRNFTSDRRVQFTLGIFIATFIYCLLVLRTIRSVEEAQFVPYLSVNIGIVLALASLTVLIFYIHHVSQSIQAETLIAAVGRDLQNALPKLFPERIGQPAEPEPERVPEAESWREAGVVALDENGYLQRVDDEQLMALATERALQLKLEKRPGDFVAQGVPVVSVLPASRCTDECQKALRACFILGSYRTPHQDALYSLQQLVEIAAHALSPGINEPFTALTCIDWLGAALRGIAGRDLPSPLRYDQQGELRVVASSLKFDEVVRAAFDQIRIYGADNPSILSALLATVVSVAPVLHRNADREVLIHHVQLIAIAALQIKNEVDREQVTSRQQEALRVLAAWPPDNRSLSSAEKVLVRF